MVTAILREASCERGGRAADLPTVRLHFYRDCTLLGTVLHRGDTKPTGFSEVKTFERYSLNPRGETSTTPQYHRDSRPPKMPTATLEWYKSNGWEFNL